MEVHLNASSFRQCTAYSISNKQYSVCIGSSYFYFKAPTHKYATLNVRLTEMKIKKFIYGLLWGAVEYVSKVNLRKLDFSLDFIE